MTEAPPDSGAPNRRAPNHGAPDHGAPDHGAPDHSAADQSAPDHRAPDHGAADQSAPDYGALDHGAPDHGAPDHVILIQAIAQRRDRSAFAALFGHFAPRVKAWMLRAGSDATAAEELAQETMLAVWQKARLFDPAKAGASTWIFTIARNLRIDTLRRERHPSDLMPDPSEDPDDPVQADRLVAMAQQEVRIRYALSLLPPEQADVIRKAFFEDKVHAQIEQELGIPLGTVKSRLRLAMVRLRAALGDLA